MNVYKTKNEYGVDLTFIYFDDSTPATLYVNDVYWGVAQGEHLIKLLLKDLERIAKSKQDLLDKIEKVDYSNKSIVDDIACILDNQDTSKLIKEG